MELTVEGAQRLRETAWLKEQARKEGRISTLRDLEQKLREMSLGSPTLADDYDEGYMDAIYELRGWISVKKRG